MVNAIGVPLSLQQRRANSSYGRGRQSHQPSKTSTQQDFDYYKKVLGLDQQRNSVFNASAKSSFEETTSAAVPITSDKKQSDSKSKQSGSIQPYVREVKIMKADVILNVAADRKAQWPN